MADTPKGALAALRMTLHIYRLQHDDECNCEGCDAYGLATSEYPEDWAAIIAIATPDEGLRVAMETLLQVVEFYVEVRPQPDGLFDFTTVAANARAALAAPRAAAPEADDRLVENP